MRQLIAALCAPILIAAGCSDSAAPTASARGIGRPPDQPSRHLVEGTDVQKGYPGLGRALSDSGYMAGYINSPDDVRAARWSPDGTMLNLGTLGGRTSVATDVNDAGSVVGQSADASGSNLPFLWTEATGMVSLGTLGGYYGIAEGINDVGQVVGEAYNASNRSRPFLWSSTTGMRDLGTLSEGSNGFAYDINDAGHVVGMSGSASGARAVLWTSEGGTRDLGTLGGGYSRAYAVNNRDEVVGMSQVANGDEHAFLWTPSSGMRDLGTLPGERYSLAVDINDSSHVVGYVAACAGCSGRAFVWTEESGFVLLGVWPGGYNTDAEAINNRGQVFGDASDGFRRFTTLWRLTFENRTPAAHFTVPDGLVEGHEAWLDASGSTDPDGDPLTYDWLFGDGTAGAGVTLPHRFAQDGTHEVALRVTDARGAVSTPLVASVSVANAIPTIAPGSRVEITSGQAAMLEVVAEDPGALDAPWTYTIVWGDGGTVTIGSVTSLSTPITVDRRLLVPGDYAVAITLADKDGGVGSGSRRVTVVALPVTASASPNRISLKKTKQFTVTVFASPGFDAAQLVTSTVTLGDGVGDEAAVAVRKNGADQTVFADANGDGQPDATYTFKTDALLSTGDLTASTNELVLRGVHADGRHVQATVLVRLVP